jgi:hypothetical protein
MTVNELKNLLEQMADEGLGDREVLFAYQANYPLQDHIAGGWIPGPADDEDEHDDATDDEVVVYLVSGGQVHDQPYGPSRAFAEAVESL